MELTSPWLRLQYSLHLDFSMPELAWHKCKEGNQKKMGKFTPCCNRHAQLLVPRLQVSLSRCWPA